MNNVAKAASFKKSVMLILQPPQINNALQIPKS